MAAASATPTHDAESAIALLHLLVKEVEWIRKLSSRLYRSPSESTSLERDLGSILDLAGSVAHEMRRFLDDARQPDRPRPAVAPIGALIDEARHRVARRAPTTRFVVSIPSEAGAARVSAEGLVALVAILENAADFGHDRAPVSIEVRSLDDLVEVRVADRGAGMQAEVLSACRTRGFTTRPGQGGHGFGLYAASRIAERCGGSLQVESRRGTGTRVRLRLPIAECREGAQSGPARP